MGRALGFAWMLCAAAPLAAQWSVGAEAGLLSFSGSSIDTTTRTDPAGARPSPSASFAVGVQYDAGMVGVRLGVLYSKSGVGVETGQVAIEEKGLMKFYRIAPELSVRVARPGPGGSLRLLAGPMYERWSLEGGKDTKRIGALGAVAIDWSLGGRWIGTLQGGAAVSAGVFSPEDLPSGLVGRATWRRSVATGVRLRL